MPSLVYENQELLAIGYSGNPSVATEVKGWTKRINKTMYLGAKGNYGYPDFPPNSDCGGPFKLIGFETYRPQIDVGEVYNGGPNNQFYIGSVIPTVNDSGFSVRESYPPDARGAEAYKKMKPTKPSFEALNAMYELKDLPGMLNHRMVSGNNLKNMSNYWLALQFGWKPLLSDIRKLVSAQMDMQKRMKQLLRDNGRPVRRQIMMQDDSDFNSESSGNNTNGMFPTFPTGYVSSAKWKQVQRAGNRWWATAQFRYWLPDGPRDINWTRSMKARIFGLNPSPSVVYNAIPWSWLVDYFTNLGDCISNLDAGVADRLAADRFYVMRERWKTTTCTMWATFKRRDGTPVPISGTASSYGFHKSRGKGDPFGFNTNQNSLTGMQLSILGALGASRLR